MNINFHHRKPPLKYLSIQQLLIFTLGPLPVNAQFRAYSAYARPSWYIGLIFVFFTFLTIITIILIIYFRERYLRRRNNATGSPGSTIFAASHRGYARGLDSDTVKAFPTVTYSEAKMKSISVDSDCAVCLNVFEDRDTLRLMPKCGHGFHPECVGTWLEAHTTCPCCRADLLSLPDDVDSPSSSTHSVKGERGGAGASHDVIVDVR